MREIGTLPQPCREGAGATFEARSNALSADDLAEGSDMPKQEIGLLKHILLLRKADIPELVI